ncbi:beta-galactosidase-like (glycoside hydrolase family 3) domain protein [Metarhizium robertsii]|uniref:Beta-galactosidase-like (Glycoside hydrolase family 3) domain protein n=1 Tax=Metarhizium robertsii TaxID=568076 RepID=A0A014N4L8_9HYPO|nr:beta-galactosidase-like (glycoside hydrolase family 3) domain protein [Metarhizium robertsii]
MPNHIFKSLVAATFLLIAAQATGCDELDILAGQHVVYSFPSSSHPPHELVVLTKAGLVGGVILFGVNVDGNTSQAMSVLKDAYESSPAPALLKKKTGKNVRFLVITDQEGGQVRRIKDGEPNLSAKKIGASADPAAAGEAAGAGAAASLKRYQCNSNLAPVLDVFRQPGDFTDYYQRSFGNTSQQVVGAAVPFITAQQGECVSACAKHFPGLGAASNNANTDEEPVVLNLTLSEIRGVDQVPYVAAIEAGVDMVMASWAVYPALDQRPAGLSEKWIKGELRGRLGFKGVTITDALEAGSLAAYGDAAARGTAAAVAGMDILLASGKDVMQGEAVRIAVVQALKKGLLGRAEFDAATERIAAVRSRIVA